ncbi:hypothetical protein M413DRAFT_275786 [Hebeloma cylindrosporum]|uniref:Uncharacterized protein n=1 Tax=Hebeloma cylindrosporum TaxID=76867 RepID=A0A0C3BZM9_HEBCY|nr:hypothetical protein M413DRAFT_275786 [Hebeloma cylindrosporum h7]
MLMVATLIHVMRGLDSNGKANLQSLAQMRKLVPTMVIYMRHGLCYYFFAITAKIANAIIVVNTTGPLQSIGIPFLLALYPVLVSRVYLDMVKYLHAQVPKRTHMLGTSTGEERNIRFSYASADLSASSPPSEHGLGQITFAARARSSLSGASILASASMKKFDSHGMV